MNKKFMLWMLLDLVFLIVFNIVFFVSSGKQHEISVWISYGFIHFAYLILLVTTFLAKKSSNIAVLRLPLYFISTVYFIAEFVVGLVFIFGSSVSYETNLIVQVIIIGSYAVMLILHMVANERTVESIERHERELRYVKKSSSKLKGIMNSVSDKQLQKKIEKIYDLIHSSPVKSDNSVCDYEMSVLKLINILEENISKNDAFAAETTIKKIEHNACERNRRLKCGN